MRIEGGATLFFETLDFSRHPGGGGLTNRTKLCIYVVININIYADYMNFRPIQDFPEDFALTWAQAEQCQPTVENVSVWSKTELEDHVKSIHGKNVSTSPEVQKVRNKRSIILMFWK